MKELRLKNESNTNNDIEKNKIQKLTSTAATRKNEGKNWKKKHQRDKEKRDVHD